MATTTKLLALALLLATASATAGPDHEALLEKLRARYPGTQISSVSDSGIAGLYELHMGRNIAYTDLNGAYFLFGHIFDMAAQRDLTAERLDAMNKVDFGSLPLQDAIKTVKGAGSRIVAVFSDPDCPYCRKLEQELAKLDDITIYTFLMPLEQLHPNAMAKSVATWCAPNRSETWKALMLNGADPGRASCDNPISRNMALAGSLGINGTPSLIAFDGSMKSGALPAEMLSSWLLQGNRK